MSVRVRVQNFQSIKDAEVIIDGLTVVTGPNNSGKTALMRAVRGVFTNPAAGPLVRHGAAYLSVTLTFDDGVTICWEKGWEKPGQKGKGINRYHINGITIQGVGRGVPPEVEILGVKDIQAASERVWPQIADQFDGTLFLLNRPGSSIAEALSDVERVGRLTEALKLSERDQRTADNERKVRRVDLESLKKEVASYDGVEDVASAVSDLHVGKARTQLAYERASDAQVLGARLGAARRSVAALEGFNPNIPALGRGPAIGTLLDEVRPLRARHVAAVQDTSFYEGFSGNSLPESRAPSMQQELAELSSMAIRLKQAQDASSLFKGAVAPSFPDPARGQKIQTAIQSVSSLRGRLQEALLQNASLRDQAETTAREYEDAVGEIRSLLGTRGICPTCETVHAPVEAHA